MKGVIHIGFPKTGTKTIQYFLVKNRNLLKEQGIFVPVTSGEVKGVNQHVIHDELLMAVMDRRESSHNAITRNFKSHLVFNRVEFTEEDQVSLWEQLRHVIVTNCNNNALVLFSSEDLCVELTDKEVTKLKHLMDSLFDDVTIVLYLRRQPETLVSFYNTLTMWLGGQEACLDYLKNQAFHDLLTYRSLCERWVIFGKENLKIRIFDRQEFQDNDLLTDFAYTVGFDITGLDRVKNKNESWNSSNLEFLRLLNRHSLPWMDSGVLNPDYLPILHCITAFLENNQKAYHLTRSEAQHILDMYREDNDWIAREYLGREKLFSEDVSMYPEEVASPHGLTLEKCAEITAALWKERCGVIHQYQQENQALVQNNQYLLQEKASLSAEKDVYTAEVQHLHDNLILLRAKCSIYLHYYKYKILAKLTFGEKRRHYKAKRDIFHEKVRSIREICKAK